MKRVGNKKKSTKKKTKKETKEKPTHHNLIIAITILPSNLITAYTCHVSKTKEGKKTKKQKSPYGRNGD
jgi:hypothetical protein